jgi:hypothetical protein
MDLIDITAKCRALLLSRLYKQGQNACTATAVWLQEWNLLGRQANPTYALRIPGNLACLQYFAMDMAYVQYPDRGESARSIRKRLYTTMMALEKAGKHELVMRIMTLYPDAL